MPVFIARLAWNLYVLDLLMFKFLLLKLETASVSDEKLHSMNYQSNLFRSQIADLWPSQNFIALLS
jgi:hypothetical protein